jgi:hypothetical protein
MIKIENIQTTDDGECSIKNSKFTDNSVLDYGGSIYSINSSFILKNNTFQNNSALIGGAVYYRDMLPLFANNLT